MTKDQLEKFDEFSQPAVRNREEWLIKRAKWLEFIGTPIGKAFNAFENAHGNAWRIDTEEGYKDWANEKRVKAAWDKQSSAYKELIRLLYEAAGVGAYTE